MTTELFVKLSKRHYEKNYSEKRKTDSGEVRIYDEAHIKARWAKKIKKLKDLDSNISKLRSKYKKDLQNKDSKIRAIAAIVGLIDGTAVRIGNDDSVEEAGTFGATTLKKKHATVSGSKIHFKFPGKDGVAQDITLDDAVVVSEIKKLLKDKKPNDFIFEYEDGQRIRAKVVNRYLSDFNITAKDLRGHLANKIMTDKLKKSKDFEKALEETAEVVGHEEKTLENQYLDPALVKKYKKAALLDMEEEDPIGNIVNKILAPDPEVIVPLSNRMKITDNETAEHKITSPYGKRVGLIDKKIHFHEGIDFSASIGDPILAFDNGTISRSGWQDPRNRKKGFGLRVYIDHGNGLMSVYAHLSKIYVRVGDNVQAGSVIGEAGATGESTGPHLHFELHLNGKQIDPAEYLKDRRVI